MKAVLKVVLGSSLACASAPQASAAVFTFSYDTTVGGVKQTASGMLFTSNDTTAGSGGRQAYRVLGISGERNGTQITGLLPASTVFGGSDSSNLLYTSGARVDSAGIAYGLSGGQDTNLYGFSTLNYAEYRGSGGLTDNPSSRSQVTNLKISQLEALEFAFSYSTVVDGRQIDATGIFYTSATSTGSSTSGIYPVLGVTGTRDGVAINGLLPASTLFGGVPSSNKLFTSGQPLDSRGIAISLADGSAINLYQYNLRTQAEYRGAGSVDVPGSSSIIAGFAPSLLGSAVPEPATWAMMLLGFGMVGAASRYRRRFAKVSFA